MTARSLVLACIASVGILAFVSTARQIERTKESDAVLTLCELVAKPAQYHRRTVVVRAVFSVGPETSVLSDPACNLAGEEQTDVEFPNGTVSNIPRKLRRLLDKLLKKDRRALVVFKGTFYGPEPVEIDPKLPEFMKEKLKGAQRRYGHMNSCATMIEVTTVEQVEKVPANVPWK